MYPAIPSKAGIRALIQVLGLERSFLCHVRILAGFVALGIGLPCIGVARPATHAIGGTTMFEHVNIVPMDRERILQDQCVLVEGDTIRAIGAHLDVPRGAHVIDGRGSEYLSPGLADMHVHSTTSRDMVLFLVNGITTVLNMGGATYEFVDQVVPKLNRGDLPGPHVYLSLRVDGTPEFGQLVVTSPAEARAVVGLAKTNGYDFIKVYNNLSPDVFEAFVDEGKKQGLPAVGHGVTRVGIERQLAAGQLMVAHAEEYLYTVFFPAGADVGNRAPRLDQIPAAVAFTKHYGAFVTADLNTYATIAQQWGKPEVVRAFLAMPTSRYLDPDDRIAWRAGGYETRTGSLDARLAFLKEFITALDKAGVPLIAGTDTPSLPGLVPGYSLHQDLHALEAIGLSRFEVLSTATRIPGQFIARAKPGAQRFGTIAVGNRADLNLSSANPLEDLSTLEHPLGVMSQGRWYSSEELASRLHGVAEKYQAAQWTPGE
jgi:imidazolonepropionase-like amidohydrolase